MSATLSGNRMKLALELWHSVNRNFQTEKLIVSSEKLWAFSSVLSGMEHTVCEMAGVLCKSIIIELVQVMSPDALFTSRSQFDPFLYFKTVCFSNNLRPHISSRLISKVDVLIFWTERFWCNPVHNFRLFLITLSVLSPFYLTGTAWKKGHDNTVSIFRWHTKRRLNFRVLPSIADIKVCKY